MKAKTKVKWIGSSGAILAIALTVLAVRGLTDDVRPVRPGSVAPGFQAVRVATGDPVTLADYEGTVLLLNIWATDCAPCEIEMPSMQRLHERYGPAGLRIVAVSIDDKETAFVDRWITERSFSFDVLHDRSGKVATDYQATGWPESFIIDRDGTIIRKAWGAKDWDLPEESDVFRRLLGLPETEGEG